jgi:hypothetical protein
MATRLKRIRNTSLFFQGIIGYFTFIPKYFEYHFRQKASTVGATGGLSQSVSSAVGILASGYIMKRFKLAARPLAAWCCIADGIFILAFVVIALMSCPPLTMHGERTENGFIQVICFSNEKLSSLIISAVHKRSSINDVTSLEGRGAGFCDDV